MKQCTDCRKMKPLNEFHKNGASRDGHQHRCKVCQLDRVAKANAKNPERRNQVRRNSWLRKQYNMTLSDFDVLLEEQDGVCFLCKRDVEQTLAVDHDKSSLWVRGLLCFSCNQSLGALGDSTLAMLITTLYCAGKIGPDLKLPSEALDFFAWLSNDDVSYRHKLTKNPASRGGRGNLGKNYLQYITLDALMRDDL